MTRDTMTTERAMMADALEENGETWDDVVHHVTPASLLDKQWRNDFGASPIPMGGQFWSTGHVYSWVEYDGSYYIVSAPRNPPPPAEEPPR
jgi:hypothetical protein